MPQWITLRAPDGQEIAFQQVAEHVAPRWPGQELPQQFHLDLQIDDHEAAADRAVGLGATRLADGATWITLADPAGHPFDLCQSDGVGPTMRLFAVTIDAPAASALAQFYAGLTGMEVTYDGPEGALITGDGKSLMFQQVSDYTPPRWPDPATRSRLTSTSSSTTWTRARRGCWSWEPPDCRVAATTIGRSPTRPVTRSTSASRVRIPYCCRPSSSANRRRSRRCSGPPVARSSASRYAARASSMRPSRRRKSARAAGSR